MLIPALVCQSQPLRGNASPCVVMPALCVNPSPCVVMPALCVNPSPCVVMPVLCVNPSPCVVMPTLCVNPSPCVVMPALCVNPSPCVVMPALVCQWGVHLSDHCHHKLYTSNQCILIDPICWIFVYIVCKIPVLLIILPF